MPLLNHTHIPMNFVLLYVMSVAFSELISCTSRCVRELLSPVYIVVSLVKAEAFSSSSHITMLLIPLFCLIFSKNISANIMHRNIDNAHSCRTLLFTRNACDKCPFTLTNLFFCFDKQFLFSVFFRVPIQNGVGL